MANLKKISRFLLFRFFLLGMGVLVLGGLVLYSFSKMPPKDVLAVAGTLIIPSTTETFSTTNLNVTNLVLGGTTVTATAAELNYVDGVTSAIQTQMNLKAPLAGPTFTGTVVLPSTTSIGTITNTELGYVDGVTSAIQTQFTAKAPLASPTFTGNVTMPGTGIWNSSGNVGLGTTAPGTKLDVRGTANFNNTITVEHADGTDQGYITYSSSPSRLAIFGAVGMPLSLGSNNSLDQVYISSGNVGIGTTAPGSKLDISGTVNTSSTITAAGAIAANGGLSQDGNAVLNGTDTWLRTTGATGWYSASYGGGWYMTDASWIKNYNAKPTYITGNGTNAAVFMSGKVGIGTTAPGYDLDVNGAIRTLGSDVFAQSDNTTTAYSTAPIQIREAQFGASSGYLPPRLSFHWGGVVASQIAIESDGTLAIRNNPGTGYEKFKTAMITDNGTNVGIGTTAPTYKLQVGGSVYMSGSSRRFKQNISGLEVDSEKIYDLRPVSFDYKPAYKSYGKELGSGRQIGLIAEEVYNVIPELAVRLDGKISNVDYEKLSVLLLSETQKQKKEIDSLKSELKTLNERLLLIESKLK